MNKKYDLAVYIGRFQPFHNGHLSVIKKAEEIADSVLVLVGSANASPSIRNPFTYNERRDMIIKSVNVRIDWLDDYTYEENQWLADVQLAVGDAKNVCIIGHSKDESSYYLNHFPQWDFIDVEYHEVIDATHIRELMYQNKMAFIKGAVPSDVFEYLYSWINSKNAISMVNEYEFIKEYDPSKYPRIEHTIDAVVIQSGHILLIQLGEQPGKGLWALPGGFLEDTETLLDGMIRELREETKLKIPEPVLRGSIIKVDTFDAVKRSSRGRVLTTAYLIQLDDNQALPKVKASSDAKHAEWITLSKFYDMPEEMFEDHYHIAQNMINQT